MGLATTSHCFNLSIIKSKISSYQTLSFHSSSSSLLLSSSLDCDASVCLQKRCNLVSSRPSPSFLQKRNCKVVVCCSQLKVDNDIDTEACELVNGSEIKIGEGDDTVNAYLFQAVKNNNGVGVLLLSDVFGFEDSYTRDFAYRVACNGYNVLVPDLFRGDPWSKERSKDQFKQWMSKHNPSKVAKDIATSTQWMVNEFMAAESSKKLGLIGFCYGGGRILEVLARDQGLAFGTGVSFYGTRFDSSAASNVKVPILFITGDDDPLCPVNTVNEFGKMIGGNSRVVVFEGRGHGFVHRPESVDEDADAEEAFKIMRNWLRDQLLDIA